MNIGQPDWLTRREVQAVFDALAGETYLVGGCIRNHLLGFPVTDIDMATVWRPDQVMRKLQSAGIKVIPTGIKHGTVTAVFNEFPIEITTFRQDIKTDGRHATVLFSDSWQGDAQRRDFTINALFADQHGNIYDCVNGLADIEHKIVRFIGNPAERIQEDYLRILRFFRFQAWFGEDIDQQSLQACIHYKNHLINLSGERVRTEFFKLLAASNPVPVIRLINRFKLLSALDINYLYINKLSRTIKRENKFKICDSVRRFAAVLQNNFRPNLKDRFKFSNEDYSRICFITNPKLPAIWTKAAWLKLLYKLKPVYAFDLIILYKTVSYNSFLKTTLDYKKPEFFVNATDLMNLGFSESPKLGQSLKIIEKQWIDSNFKLDKSKLLQIAKRLSRH